MTKDMKMIAVFVIAIAASAMTIGLNYKYPLAIEHFRTDRARYNDILILESAVKLFRMDTGRYPTILEGLTALVINTEGSIQNWRRYLDRLPKDPWGNDYVYRDSAGHGVDFQIYSRGPDGVDDGGARDDVVNWEKEYDCALNYRCPTLCERMRDFSVWFALISWILALGFVIIHIGKWIHARFAV